MYQIRTIRYHLNILNIESNYEEKIITKKIRINTMKEK